MNGFILSFILLCSSPSHRPANYVTEITVNSSDEVNFILDQNSVESLTNCSKCVRIERNEFGSAKKVIFSGIHLDYYEWVGVMTFRDYDDDCDFHYTIFSQYYRQLSQSKIDELQRQFEEYKESPLLKWEIDVDEYGVEATQYLLDRFIVDNRIDDEKCVDQLTITVRQEIDYEYMMYRVNDVHEYPSRYFKDGLYFMEKVNNNNKWLSTQFLRSR